MSEEQRKNCLPQPPSARSLLLPYLPGWGFWSWPQVSLMGTPPELPRAAGLRVRTHRGQLPARPGARTGPAWVQTKLFLHPSVCWLQRGPGLLWEG